MSYVIWRRTDKIADHPLQINFIRKAGVLLRKQRRRIHLYKTAHQCARMGTSATALQARKKWIAISGIIKLELHGEVLMPYRTEWWRHTGELDR